MPLTSITTTFTEGTPRSLLFDICGKRDSRNVWVREISFLVTGPSNFWTRDQN